MTAPTVHPDQRNPAEVAPTDSYQPTDPVWVYRGGLWRKKWLLDHETKVLYGVQTLF